MKSNKYLLLKTSDLNAQPLNEGDSNPSIFKPALGTFTGLGTSIYNTSRYLNTRKDYLVNKAIKNDDLTNKHYTDFLSKNNINTPEEASDLLKDRDFKFNRANKWLSIGGLGLGLYSGVNTVKNIANKEKTFKGIL